MLLLLFSFLFACKEEKNLLSIEFAAKNNQTQGADVPRDFTYTATVLAQFTEPYVNTNFIDWKLNDTIIERCENQPTCPLLFPERADVGLSQRLLVVATEVYTQEGDTRSEKAILNFKIVENAPPTVEITSPKPTVYPAGTILEFSGKISNPETPAGYKIEEELVSKSWYLNGEPIPEAPIQLTKVGKYELVLTAEDKIHSVEDSVIFTVSDDIKPEIFSIAFQPSKISSNQELTAIPKGRDLNAEGTTITYIWLQNGNPTSFTEDTIPASEIKAGDDWKVSILPEPSQQTEPITASIKISNSIPVVSKPEVFSSDGDLFLNSSTVDCTATVTDGDEDLRATYEISINGKSYLTDVLNLSTVQIMPNDELICIASATDSQGASSSTPSETFKIANRLPNVPTVYIKSASKTSLPLDNDNLTCVAQATDPDRQELQYSYNWSSDTDKSFVGEILPAELTEVGDTWICEATSSDGIATSSAGNASTTIMPDFPE